MARFLLRPTDPIMCARSRRLRRSSWASAFSPGKFLSRLIPSFQKMAPMVPPFKGCNVSLFRATQKVSAAISRYPATPRLMPCPLFLLVGLPIAV